MLNIQTFDARAGGNVIYKALAHPLAAEAIARLYAGMTGPVAIYDPQGIAGALLAMYPRPVDAVFVHDTAQIGQPHAGLPARALTELATSGARTVLIAAHRHGLVDKVDRFVELVDGALLWSDGSTAPGRGGLVVHRP